MGDMVADSTLIDPNCQGSMVSKALGKEHILLFANASSSSSREDMTLKLSKDDGRTWVKDLQVHKGPSAYSDLAFTDDQKIALVYEGGKRRPYEGIAINLIDFIDLKIK